MAIKNSGVVLQGIDGQPGVWVLRTHLEYCPPPELVDRFGGPEIVIVKDGFKTDLASIPRLFWNVLPPFGRYTAASIVHDYLYQAHEGTRMHADQVFLQAMRELRVSRLKRRTMYSAVRAFGGSSYRTGPQRGGIV